MTRVYKSTHGVTLYTDNWTIIILYIDVVYVCVCVCVCTSPAPSSKTIVSTRWIIHIVRLSTLTSIVVVLFVFVFVHPTRRCASPRWRSLLSRTARCDAAGKKESSIMCRRTVCLLATATRRFIIVYIYISFLYSSWYIIHIHVYTVLGPYIL